LLPFERLPWLEYGMYKDDFRASWPPPEKPLRTLAERKTWSIALQKETVK